MKQNRRSFIAGSTLIAGSFLLAQRARTASKMVKKMNTAEAGKTGVYIFHTNDLNGRVLPNNAGHGGLELLSQNIKNHEVSGLVLDSGSFLKQESSLAEDIVLIETMNRTGYHAANIGTAELGKGQDHLRKLIDQMAFTLVNCNYNFSNPAIESAVKPYVILKYGRQKIGVTGVGPQLNIAGVTYRDPAKCLNAITEILKNEEKCDRIICLGALGFDPETYNNLALARSSKYVDLVIGSNNYGAKPHGTSVVKNPAGFDVFVSHCAANAKVFNEAAFTGSTVFINAKIPGIAKSAQAKQIAALINPNMNQNNTNV